MLGRHPQEPPSIRGELQCFESIVQQVENNLLQLISVTTDKWEITELAQGGNAMIHQLGMQRFQRADHNLVEINRLPLLIATLKQGMDAVKDVAGAMPLSYYLAQGQLRLLGCRRRFLQIFLRSMAACNNCCQGLPDFVSNRRYDGLRV